MVYAEGTVRRSFPSSFATTAWVAIVTAGGFLGVAACASNNFKKEDDGIGLPDRQELDDNGNPINGDAMLTPSDSGGGGNESDVLIIRPTDGGTCGDIDGEAVYCIGRGDRIEATGTIAYGAGFTGQLPAMGMGPPGVGYIPVNVPFTCVATAGDRGKPPNNGPTGKTCEVSFDNTNTQTVIGTAKYTLRADDNAGNGTYRFGLTSNAGTSIVEPPFYLKIGQ